jgi:hypothetical protein
MQSPPVTQSPVLRRMLRPDGIAGAARFAYLNNRNRYGDDCPYVRIGL